MSKVLMKGNEAIAEAARLIDAPVTLRELRLSSRPIFELGPQRIAENTAVPSWPWPTS